MSTFPADAAPADASARLSLHRAIWRWHFFAGLVSAPFMIVLAVTGSLYLFKDGINHTVFAYRAVVTDPGTAPLPGSALVGKAIEAVPGSTASAYAEPASPTSSTIVTVADTEGKRLVYMDPYTGGVLDILHSDREPMYVLKKIHSLELFGSWANRLIEAVAGFALVLVVTGVYLWWPRGQRGGVVSVRGTPRRRVWWRDVHAITGAFAGLVIFFLAFTGLPWSGVWGAKVGEWANQLGLGYPAEMWDAIPTSTVPTKAVLPAAGWAVEDAPLPRSTPDGTASISLDQATQIAHRIGMAPGFEMALPTDPTGVYTAAIYFGDLSKERTVHIDQYSGKPLVDVGFKDYGPVGKAIEFGVNVHQGLEWGLANQLVMLATCLAIIVSSISGVVMWWKRRPAGVVGVPPYPTDPKVYRALWLAMAVVGLAFPVTGIAIVAMLAIDLLVVRTVPPLRRAFG